MALSHAIMTALLEEDLTGYDLAKKFDTSLGFFWQASHQQIYQDLKKMLEKGWLQANTVEQSAKPNKNIYALTDAGRIELDEWVASATKPSKVKEDLYVKLYNVGHSDCSPLIDEIKQRKASAENQLALYRKIRHRHYGKPSALPATRKGIYLALLAGIRQQEMFLGWCDEALALLDGLD